MHPWLNRRAVPWLECVVLITAVAYLGLHTLPRAWARLITDFPNYYLESRLVFDGYDSARMYEWTWLQREKDHRSIESEAVGLIPNTPVTGLIVWPLSPLPPLQAKRLWILINLALLVPLCWLLRSLTALSYQRIALLFALSFPLHRNLQFGQYYVFLLTLLVAACWCYVRKLYAVSGALIAIAAVAKIFPVLFLLLFIERRSWRAVASCVVTGIAAIGLSIAIFGCNVHRTFFNQVLPWALRGEAMPPYGATSISGALHHLFLAEPQWNPHPWHNSILIFALLQPLSLLLSAPAILLIRRDNQTQNRILLEWAAMLTASLAVSTLPSSYHFVLMAFPVCVLAAMMIERRRYGLLIALLIAYVVIGFPIPDPGGSTGLRPLIYAPRLFLMIAVLLGIYLVLWRDRQPPGRSWDWTRLAWAGLLVTAALLNIRSTLYLQHAVREEYAYRVPLQDPALLDAYPIGTGPAVRYIGLIHSGYRLLPTESAPGLNSLPGDELSFTIGSRQSLVEMARAPLSDIADLRNPLKTIVEDGRDPMISSDGENLSFVRSDHGRGQLMMRPSFRSEGATDVALTPSSINVYEAAFVAPSYYAFSGVDNGGSSRIYLTDQNHKNTPLDLGEARYPALSPDGNWMAYSRLERGSWNLWVRNQHTGLNRRVADLPCNQIQPSWEDDSKTLVYATDCGRSLWFTAIARRRVIW